MSRNTILRLERPSSFSLREFSRLDDNAGGTDAGAAYVLERTGGGWTEVAKLTAADGQDDAIFGFVSISGDTIVVGAPFDDNAAGEYAGAAYVFERAGGNWVQQHKLVASDAGPWDFFGRSVSISGDSIVVGAQRGEAAGGCCAGSAYVYVRSGGTWLEQQKLVAFDAAPDDVLGFSASISGDSLVLGAPSDANAAGIDAGAAYVFVRIGGSWTLQQKLLVSDAAQDDYLGWSVAMDGDTLVLGAPGNGAGQRIMSGGAAFVFVRNGGLWTEEQKLMSSDAAPFEHFGRAVSLAGERTVVGIEDDRDAGLRRGGAAVAYRRGAAGWTEEQKLGPWDAGLGRSVGISGDTLMVGVPSEVNAGGLEAGAVHVFDCVASPAPTCNAGPDVAQRCDGVQLSGSVEDPAGIPLAVRWTSSCAGASFAPSDDVLDPVVSFGSACGVSCDLTLSVDAGNGVICSDVVHVEIDDATPPSIQADARDNLCVWSPRHWWSCYERADFHPVVTDDCGAPTWRFLGCDSDQPDDDIGDGHTDPDCFVSADGDRLCVRAERRGGDPAGRAYSVTARALDGCGNASEGAIATISVPHDRRAHAACRATPRGGGQLSRRQPHRPGGP